MAQFDVNLYKSFINGNNNPYTRLAQKAEQADKKATAPIQETAPAQETKQIKENKPVAPTTKPAEPNKNLQTLKDEFVTTKKSRGLFEKFYDFCKNTTGFGLGWKKLEQKIAKAEANQFSEEELKQDIDKYKKSNTNARQSFGDLFSGLASIGTFLGLSNIGSRLHARFEIRAIRNSIILSAIHDMRKIKQLSNIEKNIKNLVASSAKTKAFIAVPLAMLAGGFTKYIALKINRIGSKEYDPGDKKVLGARKYKELKGIKKSQKRMASLKNFGTGMLNGLITPLVTLSGGIVGIPAYLIANSGIRYVTNNKDKSLSDFGKQLADNAALNAVMALSLGIPAYRHVNYSKILNQNLSIVINKLKGAQLFEPSFQSQSAFQKLESTLLNSESISKILNDYSLSTEEKIIRLTDENIFAVKFKQIQANGDELTTMLTENCPATRTIEEAGKEIARLLGTDEYKVTKLLGAASVGETYLATDKSGKEVAIKILKKGITKEKILADKEKFIQLITKGVPESELTEHQIYLKRNIENLADNILKEVDLSHEAQAAKELTKVTQKAKVVVPVMVKNGVYIMEKADGISVKTMHKYIEAKYELESLLSSRHPEYFQEEIAALRAKIDKIKAASPAFDDFDITSDHIKRMMKEYNEVCIEQFSKLNRNGKVVHGDIHPGNIFIDLEVLRGKKKGKLFTLIDTGNTIHLTKEQTKDSIRLIAYLRNGNYKDLARMATETSILPQGMTREQARSYVEEELKRIFTDTKTAIGEMTIDNLFRITDAIQEHRGIIPVNTQLTLEKSKKSARNSMNDLFDSFGKFIMQKLENSKSATEALSHGFGALADVTEVGLKGKSMQKLQETKNLLQMSPSEAIAFLRNKNMLPTNSVDHLVYTFKQGMPKAGADINLGDLIERMGQ
ncbi:MAG: hypothetical protein K6A44_07585 [bacterium]|nr:hypothetical protein [bacterium]